MTRIATQEERFDHDRDLAKHEPRKHNDMKVLLDRITKLEADLEECREYLEDHSEVADQRNEDGSKRPNRAMQLCNIIDESLHGRPS
jgi:hypothetical protein